MSIIWILWISSLFCMIHRTKRWALQWVRTQTFGVPHAHRLLGPSILETEASNLFVKTNPSVCTETAVVIEETCQKLFSNNNNHADKRGRRPPWWLRQLWRGSNKTVENIKYHLFGARVPEFEISTKQNPNWKQRVTLRSAANITLL